MDFRIGIVIGASMWLVTEQQHPDNQTCTSLTDIAEPCGCMVTPETFELTCGSDGHTYLSICFLNCRVALENIKIEVAYQGGCSLESQCSCNAAYDPVCGTDSVTYSNECVFNCFKRKTNRVWLEHYGECENEKMTILDPDEPETQIKKPENCCCHWNSRRLRTRFGNNGKRYARSSCGCGCPHERKTEAPQTPPPAKLTAQPPSCPFNNPPPILLPESQGCPNQSQACPLTDPETEKPKKKRCVCATLYRPVCGNHNTTYANFCVLDCIARKKPSVKFQYWGVCGKPQKTPWGYN